MKQFVSTLIICLGLVSLSACGSSEPSSLNLAGRWDVVFDSTQTGASNTLVFDLDQSGSSLSGDVFLDDDKVGTLEGQIGDKDVSFTLTWTQQVEEDLTLEGEATGQAFSGSYRTEAAVQGSFEGSRVQ